jgi:hypothetical protein
MLNLKNLKKAHARYPRRNDDLMREEVLELLQTNPSTLWAWD